MRKAILMMLLAVVSNSAMADWGGVTSSDAHGGYNIYTDKAAIYRYGDRVKMWIMSDYKAVQTVNGHSFPPYLSTKRQEEYDCKAGQSRVLNLSILSGNMGSGAVVYGSSDSGEWEPVSPGSVGMILWKFACGKQ